jgi:hypothetical protein
VSIFRLEKDSTISWAGRELKLYGTDPGVTGVLRTGTFDSIDILYEIVDEDVTML